MKKFFYDVCFNHSMVSQSNTDRWINFDLSKFSTGENIDYSKKEVYYLSEKECNICTQKTHPPES